MKVRTDRGMHWIYFITILSSLLISNIKGDGEIQSIGKYSNTQFEWSVGVTELSFEFCLPSSDAMSPYVWNLDEYNILKIFYHNKSSCQPIFVDIGKVQGINGWEGKCSYDIQNSCSLSSLILNFNNTRIMNFNLSINADGMVMSEQPCQLIWCPSLERSEYIDIANDSEAGFQTEAIYSCHLSIPGQIVVDGDYRNHKDVYSRQCLSNAQWNGSNTVLCAYAPSPTLHIKSSIDEQFKKDEYAINDTLTLNCTGDLGNPESHNSTYFIAFYPDQKNFLPVNETVQLTREYDDSFIQCHLENSYTKYINGSRGYSDTVHISVLFPPFNETAIESGSSVFNQSAKILHSSTLDFRFSANPYVRIADINLTFHGSIITSSLDLSSFDDMPEKMQSFKYVIKNVTNQDFGMYMLTVRSPEAYFYDSPLYVYINLTESEVDIAGGNTNLAVIIGSSVAGICILFLVCVLAFLCTRRHNRNSSNKKAKGRQANSPPCGNQKEEKINPIYGSHSPEKEERANPLYGTSACSGEVDSATYAAVQKPRKKMQKAKSSGKEEKLNPLYNPASANDSNFEEAYAEVNKKGKKGGNENPTFSAEVMGDTYAEVNKTTKKKHEHESDDRLHASAII